MSEYPISYSGPEEAWAVIWRTIGLDMESKAFDPEVRAEIRKAYEAIMDANDPSRNAPLEMDEIVVGETYRLREVAGLKKTLYGKLVKVEKKDDTGVLVTTLQSSRSHSVGEKMRVWSWMLQPMEVK